MTTKAWFGAPLMALMALLLSRPAAWGYPPAPDILIYGLAKDQYGQPLANPANLVILQASNGVQVVANVQPNLAVGINYAVRVPMDAGAIPPPYVSNALTTGTQCQLLVVVGTTTNLPIEMQGVTLSLGAPSQILAQDLTLGQNLRKLRRAPGLGSGLSCLPWIKYPAGQH